MVFEKYDSWREHPKLNFNRALRTPRTWARFWPGAGWGAGAFAVYVALEKIGVIPSGSHGHGAHGSHGHHDDKHH